jgi:hypothetical protein
MQQEERRAGLVLRRLKPMNEAEIIFAGHGVPKEKGRGRSAPQRD